MGKYLRIARGLARDRRIPRWVRGLLLIGVLPIPGPIDEIGLIVGAVILFTIYRKYVREHYRIQGMEAAVFDDTWGAWA